jgi:hypothetical protein
MGRWLRDILKRAFRQLGSPSALETHTPNKATQVNDLEWLEGYDGQTAKELLDLDARYRTDSLVLAFEQAILEKAERCGAQALSHPEHVILAVESLEREVNNGGYDQFFFNSPEYVPVIVRYLNDIGCAEAAELTQGAIDALGIEGPSTIDSTERAVAEDSQERKERLYACDERYYLEVGDLSGPLLSFIRANWAKIRLTE